MKHSKEKDHRLVLTWLFVGLVMVLVQILLGGVTRLTGSGLSITRWDIVTGIIPPLNSEQWRDAFALYQETPQYLKINEGMELSRFKIIYFWEYFHRLWARTMGFVFVIPFVIFLLRGSLRKVTVRRLMVVVGLAALAAVFGWIMVASGLIHRPWVNAYKLTIHLSLGIALFIFLFYTWLKEKGIKPLSVKGNWHKALNSFIILTIAQISFGGFVSGMKAAMNYPTWPKMNGEWLPTILLDTTHWNFESLLLYDAAGFMPALVQVVHRFLAYGIFIYGIIFLYQWRNIELKKIHWVGHLLVGIIIVQMTLGILTLLGSIGHIPVLTGVLHQCVGILFLTYLFYLKLRSK